MSQQRVTSGIVLTRIEYGEADRIITFITPDSGKIRLMAKGVRRIKSKLAGGVELFSLSNITYIPGRGDIGTLISSRLATHYGHIIEDIDRTMLGYELIKLLNKATEDEPEVDYYHLLQQAFVALDDVAVSRDMVKLWFSAQLLRLAGHTPNLQTEMDGTKLSAEARYQFNFDDTAFFRNSTGNFSASDIKFLRLLFAGHSPRALQQVQGSATLVESSSPMVRTMLQQHLHLA